MEHSLQERDSSLDLIRITATIFILCVHSIGEFGFYTYQVKGLRFMISCCLRHLFMACLPLFLMLTGYLMNKKTWSLHYYTGIRSTLITYVLASLATLVFRLWQGQSYTFRTVLLQILSFELVPYAWYIELYIGLFLMIPILNTVYHGFKNRKEKRYLILFFLFLTAIPAVTNIFDMSDPHWWMNPLKHMGKQKILPYYWDELYPLTYYFIGCYLSEFRPKCNRWLLLGLLAIHTVLIGLFNFYFNFYQVTVSFMWGSWQDWGSLFNAVTAVLIFVFFLQFDSSGWRCCVKKGLKYLSGLCLGIYLVSRIFEDLFYPILRAGFTDTKMHVEYFLPMVILVLAASALLSAVLDLCQRGILLIWKKLKKRA